MNSKFDKRDQKEQQQNSFIHRYITIMYTIKVNYSFGKQVSSLLQFTITIYPIFITLQSEDFNIFKNNWVYKLCQCIFRPDQIFQQYYSNFVQYLFLLPLAIIIAIKLYSLYFLQGYFASKSQEIFLKNIQRSYLQKLATHILCYYQQIISSHLFFLFCICCTMSLKHQYQLATEQLNYWFLIFLNVCTLITIFADSFFSAFIFETTITHQIIALDKTRQTFIHLIYQIISIFEIFSILFIESSNFKIILSLLIIVNQMTLLYDQYIHQIFLLSYQKFPLYLAMTFNLTFHSLVLIFPLNLLLTDSALTFFLYFILIIHIIINIETQVENKNWLRLFSQETKDFWLIKDSLIKLLNNDIPSKIVELLIKAVIASQHHHICAENHCNYCGHQFIMFPQQSCAVTSLIYKGFILNKIQHFVNLYQEKLQHEISSDLLLCYALLFYDFGWIMKAIKILCQLKQLKEHSQNVKKQKKEKKVLISLDVRRNTLTSAINTLGEDKLLNIQNNQSEINYKINFDTISAVKLQFILNAAKEKMKSTLGSSLSAAQQSIITEFIEDHISQDVLLTELELQVFELVNLKIDFFKQFLVSKILDRELDFNYLIYELCSKLYKVEKQLKRAFHQRPTFKLHKIITFFYGEVLCNYKKAMQFHNIPDISDHHQIQFQQIKNFNINSSHVDYIILETKDDLQNFTIQQYSYRFFNHYGDKKSSQLDFNQLLPKYLVPYHQYFVKHFLETGHSKFYKMFDTTFIRNHNRLLTSINMCFTLTNQFPTNNITMAVFIQPASQDQIFIFVDGSSFFCTFTQNLLTLFGWNESEITNICQLENLDKFHIGRFIPNFTRLVKGSKNKIITINKAQLHFPCPPDRNTVNMKTSYSTQDGFLKFTNSECDLKITKSIINKYEYFIVNILKISDGQEIPNSQVKLPKPRMSCDSFMSKIQPLEFNDNPGIAELNVLNFNNRNLPQSILQKAQAKSVSNNNLQDSNKDSLFNQQKESIALGSPNQSYIRLLSPKNQQSLFQGQQCFFSNSQFQGDGDNYLSEILDEDKLERINIKKSFMSSQTKLDVAQTESKYSLVDKILSVKSPKYLKKFLSLIFFWQLCFLLYIIIILTSLKQDLQVSYSHLEMLTIYAAIMGPHDLFFSFRVTITGYQQMQREGFISQDILPSLTDPYYEYIDLGYTELRDSMYVILNNGNLQHFFNDIIITLYFMKENQSQIYPYECTFREALYVVLQYQFAQMMTFYHHQSTSGKPFQIFLFANYFIFHEECLKLETEIKSYSIKDQQNIKNKWIAIASLFFLIQTTIYGLIQCYQMNYFIQLDAIFSLLKPLSTQDLENQITGYQKFVTAFNQNRHFIFHYNPADYYIQLIKGTLKVPNSIKIDQSTKFSINLSGKNKHANYALLFGLFSFMIIYNVVSFAQSNNYMNKYSDTIDLFSQIQNLKFRAGNLYLYREILFRWSNFTFLTDQNKLELYTLIDDALQSINDYQEFTSTVNFNKYIINEAFEDLFYEVNHYDLCQFIDEKFKNLTNKYCSLAFEQVMLNGLITSLSYISNDIRSQQAVNNFTYREEAALYEQEGSQIVTRIFFVLSNQLNDSIKIITDLNISLIQGISIGYIVCTIIIVWAIHRFYHPYLGWLFKMLKRTVYLIPTEVLINNQQIELRLKELVHRLQLL